MLFYLSALVCFIMYLIFANKYQKLAIEIQSMYDGEIRYDGFLVNHKDLRKIRRETNNVELREKISLYFKLFWISNLLVFTSIFLIILKWIIDKILIN
jgi:hypothetical protein